MGYKRQRGKDTWQLIVTVPAGRGRYRQVSRTVRGTSRHADRELARLVTEVDDGKHRGKDGTLAALVSEWVTVAGYEPSTQELNLGDLERYIAPHLGDRQVRSIKSRDLTLFYRQLKDTIRTTGGPSGDATVRRVHALIRKAFAYGVEQEWCASNPAVNARKPKPDPKPEKKPPAPAELARLFAVAADDPDWETFLRLVAATGARRSEACALRRHRVHLDVGVVEVARSFGRTKSGFYEKETKTRQTRPVPLGPDTLDALRHHLRRQEQRARFFGVDIPADAYVFSNDPAGQVPWQPDTVTAKFGRTRQAAGLRYFRLHDIRHFVGTYLTDAQHPDAAISALLGHSLISTTKDIYTHPLDPAVRAAAEAIDRLLTPGRDSL